MCHIYIYIYLYIYIYSIIISVNKKMGESSICEHCYLEMNNKCQECKCNICEQSYHCNCIMKYEGMYLCQSCNSITNVKSLILVTPYFSKMKNKTDSSLWPTGVSTPKASGKSKKNIHPKKSVEEGDKAAKAVQESTELGSISILAVPPLTLNPKSSKGVCTRQATGVSLIGSMSRMNGKRSTPFSPTREDLLIRHSDAYFKRKKIREGPGYQTICPNMRNTDFYRLEGESYTSSVNHSLQSRKVWDPSVLDPKITDAYLRKASFYFHYNQWNIYQANMNSAHKFEEIALRILHLCNYSIIRALFCILTKCHIFLFGNYIYIFTGVDIEKDVEQDHIQFQIYLNAEKHWKKISQKMKASGSPLPM